MLASHDSKGINLNYFSVCKIYYKILNYVQMYVHACMCVHVCMFVSVHVCVHMLEILFFIFQIP